MGVIQLPVSVTDQDRGTITPVDRRNYLANATQAGGVCVATFDQLEPDIEWLIERAAVINNSTNKTSLWLWLDAPNNGAPLDYTRFGDIDIADEFSPILVPAGHQLVAQWTGGNDGDKASIRVQVRVQNRPA